MTNAGIERSSALFRSHLGHFGHADHLALVHPSQQIPKKAAQQRELALAHFPNQAIEVTTGVRPAAEFARSISSLVQGGALTEAEGNDFLRAAGLL